MPISSDESLLERLINASNLTRNDLRENRLGCLSAFQKSRLAILILIHLGVSCICFGVSTVSIWLYIWFADDLPLLACILWTIGFSLLGGMWIKNAFPMLEDLWDGKVLKVVGKVDELRSSIPYSVITRVRNARITLVRYRVSGMFFNGAWVASKALPEGQKFQVYYIPTSKIIVSAEPA